jgi:hypothetical protein
MNHFTQSIALVEMSLTCAAVLVWGAQKASSSDFPWFLKIFLIVLIGNLFYWPLGLGMELPLAAYVRGAIGDLSILSLLFLWSSLLPESRPIPQVFKVLLVLTALSFYPFALGVGMIDPYVWGYGHLALLVGVLLVALVCGLCNWVKGVWIIGLAIIAWALQWHESTNLWDYLLDPFLGIWALLAIIRAFNQNRKMKVRSGYLFRPG